VLDPVAEPRRTQLSALLRLRHTERLAASERLEAAEFMPKRPAPKMLDERYVDFTRLGKIYPTQHGPQKVVDGFDLKIKKGEFVSIIGHSGCGKSTVLSMIAGLTEISEGGIILDGREIADAGPDRGIVFQAPSLVPWLTVYENVAMGVERVFPHASRAERSDMVKYYLGRVGLTDAMNKRACDLSSG
jgi:nitrate/nitrite transport system ATP-binding protein